MHGRAIKGTCPTACAISLWLFISTLVFWLWTMSMGDITLYDSNKDYGMGSRMNNPHSWVEIEKGKICWGRHFVRWRGPVRPPIFVYFPLWPLALVFAVLPTWHVAKSIRSSRRRNARLRSGLCLSCGYNLRASTSRCPECGEPIAPKTHGGRPDEGEGSRPIWFVVSRLVSASCTASYALFVVSTALLALSCSAWSPQFLHQVWQTASAYYQLRIDRGELYWAKDSYSIEVPLWVPAVIFVIPPLLHDIRAALARRRSDRIGRGTKVEA